MIATAHPAPASAKRQRSAAPGAGRAFLVFSLAYLLLLGQMPLVPLLMEVVHGDDHPHCTGTICYCKPGCQHDHHGAGANAPHKQASHAHSDHEAAMQGDEAAQPSPTSLHTCGGDGPVLVTLMLNKAFFPEPASLLPQPQPPLLLGSYQGSVPAHPVEDVFHPPRLG